MNVTDALPLLKGFLMGGSLIIAIGAQNAFVLKQGLMRHQVLLTATFCSLVDALLIALGVGGFGQFFASSPILLSITKWTGAAFLFWYGYRSFHAILSTQRLHIDHAKRKPALKTTLLTLCALSFLNPHVYLDTVILLGSIGAQFESSARPYFALGAILASFIWFFSLCYGARMLERFFDSPKSWKMLDFVIGCVMWGIAFSLLFFKRT